MKEYKLRISNELRKPSIDAGHLHRLAMVSFSFIRNTFDDLETPCWVTVINFSALNQLGQEQSKISFTRSCLLSYLEGLCAIRQTFAYYLISFFVRFASLTNPVCHYVLVWY